MKRKWLGAIVVTVTVALAVTSIAVMRPGVFGLAGAADTSPTCPIFTNPGYTYMIEYNATTGAINGVGGSNSNLTPPSGVSYVFINATLDEAMQCSAWQNWNTPGYVLPWHVDLVTKQVVAS